MTACSSDEPGPVDNTYKGVELTPAESEICEAMGKFNIDLFQALVDDEDSKENLIISPLSTSIFLSMHANYSPETTQAQISKALGSSNIEVLNTFNAKMISTLGILDNTTTLNIANSVWYDSKYSLNNIVNQALLRYYNVEIFPCNPLKSDTKDLINGWIKNKTNNKIKDLYDGTPFTSLVLNALYFNGTWKDEFNKSHTSKEKFYVGEKIYMVDMMKRIDVYEDLAKGDNFMACRREYGNGAYSCMFILPDEDCDINDFIANLSYSDIASLNFENRKCDIFIPKFEIQKRVNDLNEILEKLGIYIYNNPLNGGLSKNGESIIQEAYINLDEKGTEVAAVTSAIGTIDI